MKNKSFINIYLLLIFLGAACTNSKAPLRLHPENPHYFLFRGEPAILMGSTEHYGAVMNLDFDYIKYLDELKSKGLNVTRTFTGIYTEPLDAFGIADNTMAPGDGKLICPWSRSSAPGYAGGGNKFDLTKWEDNYFNRLKNFVSEAGKRNIVVELDLFSNFYDTLQWKLSPLNFANNINDVEKINDHKEVLSLRHPEILKLQEAMVKKILSELNGFDNLYYEVCNEPYFGDVDALNAWQKHMTAFVYNEENKLPNKHLISNNIGNGSQKIENQNEGVSIFNFHYAKPPTTVALNYGLNKPIGDNETGFNGIEDVHYRTEAWDFLVAGGALFNNLDYSFTTKHPDGSFVVVKGQPGGGGPLLRSQLQTLKNVMDEFDFVHMVPSDSIVNKSFSNAATIRALAKEGEQYLLYLNNAQPAANYSLRYSGFLTAPQSGKYWIYTVSDDGVKLYLNDKLLINNWTDHGSVTDSVLLELKAGEKLPLTIEFYQAGGGAELVLKWCINNKKTENIQLSAFLAPDGKTPGLRVEKFADKELKNKIGEMVVSKVDATGISNSEVQKSKTFDLFLELPKGNYTGEWIDPVSGQRSPFEIKNHSGGICKLTTPYVKEDLGILLKAK